MFSLQTERDGDTRILRLLGELDMATATPLEAELKNALADGDCRIVVDMRGLDFIDSTGIAILVAALSGAGGEDKLRFIPSQAQAVNRVLQLTGVEGRMPLADGDSADPGAGPSGNG